MDAPDPDVRMCDECGEEYPIEYLRLTPEGFKCLDCLYPSRM